MSASKEIHLEMLTRSNGNAGSVFICHCGETGYGKLKDTWQILPFDRFYWSLTMLSVTLHSAEWFDYTEL
jgi:hypothetical protein